MLFEVKCDGKDDFDATIDWIENQCVATVDYSWKWDGDTATVRISPVEDDPAAVARFLEFIRQLTAEAWSY